MSIFLYDIKPLPLHKVISNHLFYLYFIIDFKQFDLIFQTNLLSFSPYKLFYAVILRPDDQ